MNEKFKPKLELDIIKKGERMRAEKNGKASTKKIDKIFARNVESVFHFGKQIAPLIACFQLIDDFVSLTMATFR